MKHGRSVFWIVDRSRPRGPRSVSVLRALGWSRPRLRMQ